MGYVRSQRFPGRIEGAPRRGDLGAVSKRPLVGAMAGFFGWALHRRKGDGLAPRGVTSGTRRLTRYRGTPCATPYSARPQYPGGVTSGCYDRRQGTTRRAPCDLRGSPQETCVHNTTSTYIYENTDSTGRVGRENWFQAGEGVAITCHATPTPCVKEREHLKDAGRGHFARADTLATGVRCCGRHHEVS